MNRVMASHQRAGNALADQPWEANVSSSYKSMSKSHHSNRLGTKIPSPGTECVRGDAGISMAEHN